MENKVWLTIRHLKEISSYDDGNISKYRTFSKKKNQNNDR